MRSFLIFLTASLRVSCWRTQAITDLPIQGYGYCGTHDMHGFWQIVRAYGWPEIISVERSARNKNNVLMTIDMIYHCTVQCTTPHAISQLILLRFHRILHNFHLGDIIAKKTNWAKAFMKRRRNWYCWLFHSSICLFRGIYQMIIHSYSLFIISYTQLYTSISESWRHFI